MESNNIPQINSYCIKFNYEQQLQLKYKKLSGQEVKIENQWHTKWKTKRETEKKEMHSDTSCN